MKRCPACKKKDFGCDNCRLRRPISTEYYCKYDKYLIINEGYFILESQPTLTKAKKVVAMMSKKSSLLYNIIPNPFYGKTAEQIKWKKC